MANQYETAQLSLARITATNDHSLRQALLEACAVTANAMEIARISIWLFMPDGDVMRCEYLYQPDQAEAFEGTLLYRKHFPRYFKALELERAVPIADMSDPGILEEFLENYMKPLGITAMLDAPIYRTGKVIGIVCHEQTGESRPWTADDEQLAACTADNVSRLYEEAARQQAEQMLHAHQNHAQALERTAMIGQMAGGVAHDFKNVLQGIMSYGSMINQLARDNPQIRALVEKQMAVVDAGVQLSQNLLSLGRQEGDHPRVVDAGEIIRNFLPLLQNAVGHKAAISADLPPTVCQIFIDSNQLQRVLLNLVINARDAITENGNIAIRLYEAHRPLNTGDNGLYVTIEVADDGVGMDGETRKKIFQPYFTTKGKSGTGLGMTIIQQIVTLAGGFVDIDSSFGKGTRIRIRLPRIGNARQ